jgi:hypothetical protein
VAPPPRLPGKRKVRFCFGCGGGIFGVGIDFGGPGTGNPLIIWADERDFEEIADSVRTQIDIGLILPLFSIETERTNIEFKIEMPSLSPLVWEKPSPSRRNISSEEVQAVGRYQRGWRVFLGLIGGGQDVGIATVPATGQMCMMHTNCYQLGAGLYGAATHTGTLGIQSRAPLVVNETIWSVGLFAEGQYAFAGVLNSIDMNMDSLSLSGGKAVGAGGAGGVQFCGATPVWCSGGGD